jgi:hypothetical protein
MRGIIVATWLLAALLCASCSRQEGAWTAARRENSAAAYEDYLSRYPAGPRAAEARAAIAAIREAEAWSRAERLATPEAWQRYLGEFPDGDHADGARQRLIAFIPPGPPPASGLYVVQVGAYSTEAAAKTGLARAAAEHGTELAGIGLEVAWPRVPDEAIWRLRTLPLPEAAAREMCGRLRAAGVDCVPLPDDSAGQPAP